MEPWHHQEIFSMDELVNAFSIDRIGKAGARFDIQKAQWFNQHYLRAKSDAELSDILLNILQPQNVECPPEKATKIVSIMRERITFPQDLWEQGKFFFFSPTVFDEGVVAKKWNDEAVKVLTGYKTEISKLDTFDAAIAKSTLENVTATLGIGTGKFYRRFAYP